MKRMLKNQFMMVLITAVCIALFVSISWAGSRATHHHNTSYDTDSRNLGIALKVKSGYSGYNNLLRYVNHGYNKHGYRRNYHRNRYGNKHNYFRQGYGHKHNKYRQRHRLRHYYGYKQGYSGHHRDYKYGYNSRHYVYRGDDKYNHKGYKSDSGKVYDNNLEHASKHIATRVTRINKSKGHVYIDKGKNAGFVMGSTVCIYSFTGEETACGRVRKISESHAMIEINNRKAKHIKNGMEVMLMVEEKDQSDPYR